MENVLNVIKNENGVSVIDSREVAEMMGKQHGDLMKDIQGSGKNLGIIPVLTKGNFPVVDYFIESTYKDKKGETRKCYLCTKSGCEMLGNKLQGEKGILFTATYVQRFNQMEKQIKSQVPQISKEQELVLSIYNGGVEAVEAVKQLTKLKVNEAIKPLNAKIEKSKPLVHFANTVSKSEDSIDIGKLAKLVKDENINMGRNKLFAWLRDNKYLMKDNQPYQKYIDNGIFEYIEYTFSTPYKSDCLGHKTLVSGKGQLYIIDKLRKEV